MNRLRESNAQTALEYALMIFAIIGGLVLMQVFFKRAQEGRLKEELSKVGKQFDTRGNYSYSWDSRTENDAWTETTETTGVGGRKTTITTGQNGAEMPWSLSSSNENWSE